MASPVPEFMKDWPDELRSLWVFVHRYMTFYDLWGDHSVSIDEVIRRVSAMSPAEKQALLLGSMLEGTVNG